MKATRERISYKGRPRININDNATPVSYTITNNLINLRNTSSIASVSENESYSTMLRPTINYVIDNVTVTMGDVDITNTVYSDATINIPDVNGNFVISGSGKVANVTVKGGTLINSYNLSQAAEDGTYTDSINGWNLDSTKKVSRTATLPKVDRFGSFSIVLKCTFNWTYEQGIFSTGTAGGVNITSGQYYNTYNGRLLLNRGISYGNAIGSLYIGKRYTIDNGALIENIDLNGNIPVKTETSIILVSDADSNTTKIYVGGFLACTLNEKSNIDGLTIDPHVSHATVNIYSGAVEVGV